MNNSMPSLGASSFKQPIKNNKKYVMFFFFKEEMTLLERDVSFGFKLFLFIFRP